MTHLDYMQQQIAANAIANARHAIAAIADTQRSGGDRAAWCKRDQGDELDKAKVQADRITAACRKSRCVYPDWEGGMTSGKHSFDKDGYCNVCGEFDQNRVSQWTCRLCGNVQPSWATECLTCAHTGMMGDRD